MLFRFPLCSRIVGGIRYLRILSGAANSRRRSHHHTCAGRASYKRRILSKVDPNPQ